jgi:hypothetical protein
MKLKVFLVCLLLGLTVANFASAQLVNCGGQGQTECQIIDLVHLIERIINFLLAWAWLVSLFYIMWAAYNMLGSGGNTEKLEGAKSTLSHAIIGFFLIMAAYLLINWVVSLLTGNAEPRGGSFDVIRSLLFR